MKHLLLVAFFATPSFAQETTPEEMCPVVGSLAEATLEAYYSGVPMSQLLAIDSLSEIGRLMIMDAYDEPRYSTEEMIAEATFDFRTLWEHRCYTALNN